MHSGHIVPLVDLVSNALILNPDSSGPLQPKLLWVKSAAVGNVNIAEKEYLVMDQELLQSKVEALLALEGKHAAARASLVQHDERVLALIPTKTGRSKQAGQALR